MISPTCSVVSQPRFISIHTYRYPFSITLKVLSHSVILFFEMALGREIFNPHFTSKKSETSKLLFVQCHSTRRNLSQDLKPYFLTQGSLFSPWWHLTRSTMTGFTHFTAFLILVLQTYIGPLLDGQIPTLPRNAKIV